MWIDTILDMVFPPKCALCSALLEEEEVGICRNCYESRGIILEHFCRKCGKSLEPEDRRCFDCNRNEPIFTQGHGLFPYEEIKDVILKIKYQRQKWRAASLSKLMAWLYEAEVRDWQIDAIVFVPQNRWSLGEKGYNPPEVMAKILAKEWKLPLLKGALGANKKAKSQKTLSITERKKNLNNVFYCKSKIPFQNILLVDDVYTTGATINACSRLLQENGAKKVYFLTWAIGELSKQ